MENKETKEETKDEIERRIKEANEKFNRPEGAGFCKKCNLEEGIFCDSCAKKQFKKLEKFNKNYNCRIGED